MGYYIDFDRQGRYLPSLGKLDTLLSEGGVIIDDTTFVDNMVCVVDNGNFEAAAYCWSPDILECYRTEDGRDKTWITLPDAAERAGYKDRVY